MTEAVIALTALQMRAVLAAIRAVAGTKEGCGEVKIIIKSGRVRFVQASPSLDLNDVDTAEMLERMAIALTCD